MGASDFETAVIACSRSKRPRTLSTLPILVSSVCNLCDFSPSLFSKTLTLSSSLARVFRSWATISFACSNSCPVNSSISLFVFAAALSAALRRDCSCVKADIKESSEGEGETSVLWGRSRLSSCGVFGGRTVGLKPAVNGWES